MFYLLFSFVVYLEKLSAPTLYIVKCNGVTVNMQYCWNNLQERTKCSENNVSYKHSVHS